MYGNDRAFAAMRRDVVRMRRGDAGQGKSRRRRVCGVHSASMGGKKNWQRIRREIPAIRRNMARLGAARSSALTGRNSALPWRTAHSAQPVRPAARRNVHSAGVRRPGRASRAAPRANPSPGSGALRLCPIAARADRPVRRAPAGPIREAAAEETAASRRAAPPVRTAEGGKSAGASSPALPYCS